MDIQIPVQSVPFTTNVVSSNATRAIQYYAIKFVNLGKTMVEFLRNELKYD
jgi:hypothetical protein